MNTLNTTTEDQAKAASMGQGIQQRYVQHPDDKLCVIDVAFATSSPDLVKVMCRCAYEGDAAEIVRQLNTRATLVDTLRYLLERGDHLVVIEAALQFAGEAPATHPEQ